MRFQFLNSFLIVVFSTTIGYGGIIDGLPDFKLDNLRYVEKVPVVVEAKKRFQSGDYDSCLALLTKAKSKNENLPHPRVVMAWMFLSKKQLQPVHQLLEQSAIDAPADPQLYLTFGQLAIAENRFTDAALHFEKSLALPSPTAWSEDLKKQHMRSSLAGQVLVAEARENWKVVLEKLDKLAGIGDPTNAAITFRTARAQFHLGNEDAALKLLRSSKDETIQKGIPEVMLAGFAKSQGNQQKTSEWISEALKNYPNDQQVLQSAAEWELTLGHLSNAKRYATKAEKAGETTPQIQLVLGQVALEEGEYPAAESYLRKVFNERPSDLHSANQLVLSLSVQKDKLKRNRALELAQMNSRQYPRIPEVIATLGWTQFQTGQVDLAKRTLSSVVAPGRKVSSDAAYFLAELLFQEGELDEAKKWIDASLTGTPGRFTFRKRAVELQKSIQTVKPK